MQGFGVGKMIFAKQMGILWQFDADYVALFETELGDKKLGLLGCEKLLMLAVRLGHRGFKQAQVTAESASRNVISEAEIFFGYKCGLWHSMFC